MRKVKCLTSSCSIGLIVTRAMVRCANFIVEAIKEAKRNASTHIGSGGKMKSKDREINRSRLSEVQSLNIEKRGPENFDAHKMSINRPAASMLSDTYWELDLQDEEAPKTSLKTNTATILKDKNQGSRNNNKAHEISANRPTSSTHSGLYCELDLLDKEKPSTKPKTVTSTILRDKKHLVTQAIYEMFGNRPSATMQSETYCGLQIMEKSNHNT